MILSPQELNRWLKYRDEEASYFVHIWTHLRPQWFKVDIGLDDDGYYQYYDHPLWLYFKNSYYTANNNWLPLCICAEPHIPLPESTYELIISEHDFNTVKKFARRYADQLKQVADGKNSSLIFDALEADYPNLETTL